MGEYTFTARGDNVEVNLTLNLPVAALSLASRPLVPPSAHPTAARTRILVSSSQENPAPTSAQRSQPAIDDDVDDAILNNVSSLSARPEMSSKALPASSAVSAFEKMRDWQKTHQKSQKSRPTQTSASAGWSVEEDKCLLRGLRQRWTMPKIRKFYRLNDRSDSGLRYRKQYLAAKFPKFEVPAGDSRYEQPSATPGTDQPSSQPPISSPLDCRAQNTTAAPAAPRQVVANPEKTATTVRTGQSSSVPPSSSPPDDLLQDATAAPAVPPQVVRNPENAAAARKNAANQALIRKLAGLDQLAPPVQWPHIPISEPRADGLCEIGQIPFLAIVHPEVIHQDRDEALIKLAVSTTTREGRPEDAQEDFDERKLTLLQNWAMSAQDEVQAERLRELSQRMSHDSRIRHGRPRPGTHRVEKCVEHRRADGTIEIEIETVSETDYDAGMSDDGYDGGQDGSQEEQGEEIMGVYQADDPDEDQGEDNDDNAEVSAGTALPSAKRWLYSPGRVLSEEVAESVHSAGTSAILELGSVDRNMEDDNGSLDRNINDLIPSDAVARDDDMMEDDNDFDLPTAPPMDDVNNDNAPTDEQLQELVQSGDVDMQDGGSISEVSSVVSDSTDTSSEESSVVSSSDESDDDDEANQANEATTGDVRMYDEDKIFLGNTSAPVGRLSPEVVVTRAMTVVTTSSRLSHQAKSERKARQKARKQKHKAEDEKRRVSLATTSTGQSTVLADGTRKPSRREHKLRLQALNAGRTPPTSDCFDEMIATGYC